MERETRVAHYYVALSAPAHKLATLGKGERAKTKKHVVENGH
jgi:hypothetical protein